VGAPRYEWKLVRFASKVLRVFADTESGELAVAMTDERYAFHVKQGGERRPDDCPEGVRWLDPSQPMLVSTSDTAFIPIRVGLGAAVPAVYLCSGVLIPTNEAFAFAEQFGFQIQAPGATRLTYFRVERWDAKNRSRHHVVFRGEHYLTTLRTKDRDPRYFLYLETELISAEDDEQAAVAVAEALERRHTEIRRLWRSSQRSKASEVPAVMRIVDESRASARRTSVGAA
jgi:hypothetical protein